MLHYLIELAVWLLGTFVVGAGIGYLLRALFGAESVTEAPLAEVAAATPVAAATGVAQKMAVTTDAAASPVALAQTSRGPRMERPRGIALARDGKPDNLLRISGVGSKNEKILHSLGYFHYDQIAAWTPENVAWVDDHLKFNGRIDREEWINQSRLLANGDEAEFARLYGSGGEGQQEVGIRTVRGPNEKSPETVPAMALKSAKTTEDDEKAAASGKMVKPKGIAKARGDKADDLKRISGIGPKNENVLHSLGFFHFDQIAAWTSTEVNWVDDYLKFNGRIKREEWIRQARLLAEGKEAEFAKLYGTGGLKNKKGDGVSGSRTRKP